MADNKSKPRISEGELDDREERRRDSEKAEQQDLNQGGADTGTHDTSRHGVEWGRSYKQKSGAASKGAKRQDNQS